MIDFAQLIRDGEYTEFNKAVAARLTELLDEHPVNREFVDSYNALSSMINSELIKSIYEKDCEDSDKKDCKDSDEECDDESKKDSDEDSDEDEDDEDED